MAKKKEKLKKVPSVGNEIKKIHIDLNPPTPSLPKFEDKTKIDVRYTVISPYVSIHIHWDEKVGL